jgi:ParB family chromosome partitioning protein
MASKGKKLASAVDLFEKNIDGTIRKINLSEISPSENQPREDKDINVDSLASSLKKDGLLQPIVVTKADTSSGYMIIAGERRYRAATSLGWKEIECRILNRNEKETYKLAVIENLQRENLNPIEEAKAYYKLKESYDYSDAELAQTLGKSRNYINEILSIAELSPDWQDKAKTSGMNSKNLLIQFAQAVKLGEGNDFIDLYQSGALSSVKSAKEFIKDKKSGVSTGNTAVLTPSSLKDTKVNFYLHSEWESTDKLSVNIQIDGANNKQIRITAIEKLIEKTLTKFLTR